MLPGLGSVLVYQAFFSSLDSFDYCRSYLSLSSWMDELLWDAQEQLARKGTLEVQREGLVERDGKHFSYVLSDSLRDSFEESRKLFDIDLIVSWRSGARQAHIRRTTYALHAS